MSSSQVPSKRGASAGAGSALDGVVHLRIPASPAHVRLVRLMVVDLAGQLDFDLETISELRIAADEVCAELIQVAARPDADLDCEFRLNGRDIEMRAMVPARPGALLDQHGFGWQVIKTMVDEAEQLDRGALRAENSGLAAIPSEFLGIRLAKGDPLDGT